MVACIRDRGSNSSTRLILVKEARARETLRRRECKRQVQKRSKVEVGVRSWLRWVIVVKGCGGVVVYILVGWCVVSRILCFVCCVLSCVCVCVCVCLCVHFSFFSACWFFILVRRVHGVTSRQSPVVLDRLELYFENNWNENIKQETTWYWQPLFIHSIFF